MVAAFLDDLLESRCGIRCCTRSSPTEEWRRLLVATHGLATAERWLRVVRRFEDVLPTSLMVVPSGHRRQKLGSAAQALREAAPVDRIEIPRSSGHGTGDTAVS